MIKLKYETINTQSFGSALFALGQKQFSDVKVGWNIARLLKQYTKELNFARETFDKMVDPLYLKDETGKRKMAEKPNGVTPFALAEGKEEEFQKKMKEFMEIEVELKSWPVTFKDLAGHSISPNDLVALEPIFDQASFSQLESLPSEKPSPTLVPVP